MSELCPRFCPALRECQRHIDSTQKSRLGLHELAAALAGVSLDALDLETIDLDADLAADIAENSRVFSIAYEGLFRIRQLQANCYGPIPNMRGRNLIRDYSSFNIHDEIALTNIFTDSSCSNPEVQRIVKSIPSYPA